MTDLVAALLLARRILLAGLTINIKKPPCERKQKEFIV
jgi:hypothetical protein